MYKIIIIIISLFALNSNADMSIIKDGNIVAQKLYSKNESTLIISKSQIIYVCSVHGEHSKCIQSNVKNKDNF